jgi:hypothetical protein
MISSTYSSWLFYFLASVLPLLPDVVLTQQAMSPVRKHTLQKRSGTFDLTYPDYKDNSLSRNQSCELK